MNHLLNLGEGFVYFYLSGNPHIDGNVVKIGATRRGETPEERVAEIDRIQPYKGKLLFSIFSKECHKTEKSMHDYYSEKRTEKDGKREWFLLTQMDIQDIINFKFPPPILKTIRQDFYFPHTQDSSSKSMDYSILNPTKENFLDNSPLHDAHLSDWKKLLVERTTLYGIPVSVLYNHHTLTLLQFKLIHLLFYRNFHTEDRRIFTFSVLDIWALTHSSNSSSMYEYVRKNVNQLSIQTYNCFYQNRKIQYVDYCTYSNGCFKLRLSEGLYSMLKSEDYMKVQVDLLPIMQCKRLYSIRLYEILIDALRRNLEQQIDLVKLKSILLGEQDARYQLYGHFKNKVILPALVEIEQLTTRKIELSELKQYRKVTHLVFREK